MRLRTLSFIVHAVYISLMNKIWVHLTFPYYFVIKVDIKPTFKQTYRNIHLTFEFSDDITDKVKVDVTPDTLTLTYQGTTK